MKRIKIAFDIDGVCVDIMKQIIPEIKRITGIDISNQKRFNIEKEFNINDKDILSAIYKSYMDYNNTKIYSHIENLLYQLYNTGFEPIRFVTSRPTYFATETFKLVERFCKVPFEITLIKHIYRKGHYLDDYPIFIDDKRRTALRLAQTGKLVFLPNHSYNQIDNQHENIIRLKNGVQDLLPIVNLLAYDKNYHITYINEIKSKFKE